MVIIYSAFNVYRHELAPGTVSLTGDRAQGDDSKHWANSTDFKGSQTDLDAPGCTSWSVLLNVTYHKEHDSKCFRGDLNGFRDIKPFMKSMGGKNPAQPRRTSHFVLLNTSSQNKRKCMAKGWESK